MDMPPHPLRDQSSFLTEQALIFYRSLPKTGRPFTTSELYRVLLVNEPKLLELSFLDAVRLIPLPKRIIGTPRHRKEIAFVLGSKKENVLYLSTWNRSKFQTIGDILRLAKDPNDIDGLLILSRMYCARHAKRAPSNISPCYALHGIAFISGYDTFEPLLT